MHGCSGQEQASYGLTRVFKEHAFRRAVKSESVAGSQPLRDFDFAKNADLVRAPHGLQCLRENPCRPYGARVNFPLYPALKRRANLFRAYGAGFQPASSHCRCRNIVLTRSKAGGSCHSTGQLKLCLSKDTVISLGHRFCLAYETPETIAGSAPPRPGPRLRRGGECSSRFRAACGWPRPTSAARRKGAPAA